MSILKIRRGLAGPAMIALALATGCMEPEEWERWKAGLKNKGAQPKAEPQPASASAGVRDTIGPLVTVEGLRYNEVRGFGMVRNLVDGGGSDAPDIVRRYIANEIRRRELVGGPNLDAEEILKSRDTAIVEVTGQIPAAAEKGTRFDVYLRAMGSQAQSLVGGQLVLCNLSLFVESPREVLQGEKLAEGRGPVFVSPFGRNGEAATTINKRSGMVLGGGIVTKPRTVRLILVSPSYQVAQQIQSRLNSRYGSLKPVANALSYSYVQIDIPPEYQNRKKTFLDLVLHTTIPADRDFLDNRTIELAKEIVHPEAAYEDISLAWEAIGETVKPVVEQFYEHPAPATRFYAARTGARLGDSEAVEVIASFAKDRDSIFRSQAIEELGTAAYTNHQAGERLAQLLDDDDVRVRIDAYRALRNVGHPIVQTSVLGVDNVILDVIDCTGPHMIYVQRSLQPRIALFGRQMACRPPAMYPPNDREGGPWDTAVLISANPEADAFTIIRRNKRTHRSSPGLRGPLNVAGLIKYLAGEPLPGSNDEPMGLAVPYSEIVDILNYLVKTEVIQANFEVERPRATESLIPEKTRERPESEL